MYRIAEVALVLMVVMIARAAGDPESWVIREEGTGLPVILTAPHGGMEYPSHIPNRSAGCWIDGACVWRHDCGDKDTSRCKATTVTDLNTDDLAIKIKEELCRICNACPHLVYTTLRRRKVDLNREINTAAFGVAEMEEVWSIFHDSISATRASMTNGGLLIDIHGHGHTIQRAELGYLIYGSRLDSGSFTPDNSSIRYLHQEVDGDFEDLLRGESSFGGLLEAEGYASVPSPTSPGPAGASYFSGGYITQSYGSRNGGVVDAIQIESPRDFRASAERPDYAKAVARAIKAYLELYYEHAGLPWLAEVQANTTAVPRASSTQNPGSSTTQINSESTKAPANSPNIRSTVIPTYSLDNGSTNVPIHSPNLSMQENDKNAAGKAQINFAMGLLLILIGFG